MKNESMKQQNEYAFSVIMWVHDAADYLQESVDCLLAQKIGFEKLQVILAEDGSKDNSGTICEKLAKQFSNIQVIHMNDQGISACRNKGMKLAKGRYLNFMNAGDTVSLDTFKKVHAFFEENESEIDVVNIPTEFFGAKKEPFWTNYRFQKGSRVLDLFQDYDAPILYANACFIKKDACGKTEFDERLVSGADMKFLLMVLADKMKYGLVSGCQYNYRRRTMGSQSMIHYVKKQYGWYFDYFKYLIDWAVEFYQNKYGFFPAFVQCELLADLQWRVREDYDMSAVLNKREIEKYLETLYQSFRLFDDEYIMKQRNIYVEHKYFILNKKYQREADITKRSGDLMIHYGNTKVRNMSEIYSRIEAMKLLDGNLIVSGYSKVLGLNKGENIEIYLSLNGAILPCQIGDTDQYDESLLGELVYRGIPFEAEVKLAKEAEYTFQIYMKVRDVLLCKKDIRYRGDIAKKFTADQDIFTLECKKNQFVLHAEEEMLENVEWPDEEYIEAEELAEEEPAEEESAEEVNEEPAKEKRISLMVNDVSINYRIMNNMSIQKSLFRKKALNEYFDAVKHVSFELEEGEIFGIIGKNGSGKSTLLRAIAGVFSPNEGSIDLMGHSVSLMALGVGFKNDLTGRDNIALSGMLLGFSEEEIQERMSAIIEFAEIGDFIDRPVKTYSSGMHSKLAFAITAMLETDIMLIDEVLSVGDEKFKRKSLAKMRELINDNKRTVVIVSHSIETLKELCNRVLWIHDGEMIELGEPAEVLEKYKEFMER